MTQVIVQKLSDNDSAKAGVLQVTQRAAGSRLAAGIVSAMATRTALIGIAP